MESILSMGTMTMVVTSIMDRFRKISTNSVSKREGSVKLKVHRFSEIEND